MADKREQGTEISGQEQKIERALVAADGTITVPGCEGQLVSVDVADVDLLLGFADGTYVVIPNGALDALSDTPKKVVFAEEDDTAFDEAHFSSDHQASLGDLFKMVGSTDHARAGSIRVVSEKVDAPDDAATEFVALSDDTPGNSVVPEVVRISTGGKGPGATPVFDSAQLIDIAALDPSPPVIPPRPSVFRPGQKIENTAPTIRLDSNITPDDYINIAESDPAYMVTVTGSVGGSALIGDLVSVTVGGQVYTTPVLADMTFSCDIAGNLFVDPAYPIRQVDAEVTSSFDGKTATDSEFYDIDLTAPNATITLDPVVTANGDSIVNIDEAAGTVTITGTVNEASGDDLAGAQITVTVNGNQTSGFVNPDGQTFSVDVPGADFAPLPAEGVSGTIAASIDAIDPHGNAASASDPDGEGFGVDTIAPTATIQIDVGGIAGDGMVNFAESLGNVAITGTVGGDAQDGDTVSLVVNGQTYSGSVAGGAFSINVAGSDLVAEAGAGGTGSVTASVEAFDAAENSFTAVSAAEAYTVDTNLPQPTVSLDAITGDNVINDSEAGTSRLAITGSVGGDAQIGDQITITVNGAQVADGFVSSDYTFSVNVDGNLLAAVGDGGVGNVVATITTSGTGGAVSQDSLPVDYSVDRTAPSPSITVDDITPVDITTVNTVNIAEAATDVVVTGSVDLLTANAGDEVTLTVNNTDYAGLVRSDGSFSINVSGADLVNDPTQTIKANITSYDAAGNQGVGTFDKAYNVDVTRPTATIVVDDDSLTVGEASLVTITFNEAVTDFSNADLTVANGTLDTVTTIDGGTTWTAQLTPNAPIYDIDNLISLNLSSVTDLAGNAGGGTVDSNNYLVDTIAPQVLDVTVDDSLLTDSDVGNLLTVTVTFSEPMDILVAPTINFGVDMSGSLNQNPGNWDATGTVYTETYTVLDGDFEGSNVTIDISGAIDANGNLQLDYVPEAELGIDTRNPGLITFADDNLDGVVSFSDRTVNYTLTFSEEVQSISAGDLSISGGTLTIDPLLSADGLSAIFSVTAFDKSDVDLVVSVNNTIVDLNGNSLIPPSPSILPVDTLNPRVTITEDNLDGIVSDEDSTVNYTLTFSTEVADVTAADLTISGGALASGPVFSADGLSATFSVTAFNNSNDDLVVTVNNTITDLSGRPLVEDSNVLTVDTQNPTVLITTDNLDGTVSPNDIEVTYTLTFSEEISSISDSDLTITGGTLTSPPVLEADGVTVKFSVTALDNSTTPIVVKVLGTVSDLTGNTIDPTDPGSSHTIPVDTYGTTGAGRINDALITDSDAGSAIFVSVEFFGEMDETVTPNVTFSHDISSTLDFVMDGWTSGGTIYFIRYTVLDNDIDLSNVVVTVDGAVDIDGNPFPGLLSPLEFVIDTKNPVATITNDNFDGLVSDEDSIVNYSVTFDEAVTSLDASDLTITGGALTGGPDLAADGLSATFQVTALDESTADLVVTINSTVADVNGNQLQAAVDTLLVDTINYSPDINARLYTSDVLKVTGGSGLPTGAYDPAGTYPDHLQASSPSGQSTRERIDGDSLDNNIVHNSAFHPDSKKWVKTLHLDFTVFTELTTISLVVDAAAISGIPNFNITGTGVTQTAANVWTITPDSAMSLDMLTNGLDLDILYDVVDSGGTIDFDISVDVDGLDGATAYNVNKSLDFTWRDAVNEADFTVIDPVSGNQMMVLPSDGLGVDIYAGAGDDTVSAGAGDDTVYGDAGIDTIDGGTGNDLLYGGDDGDFISGGDGDDILYGDAGGDSLDGGLGSDLLHGGVGGDSIDGGAGVDTVSFVGSLVDNVASLESGVGSGGDAAGDTYLNVENLIGGDGNDSLTGDAGDNSIDAGAGDDTVIGGAALTGDTLIGGAGIDTLSYAGSVTGVNVSLADNTASGGDATGDTISGFENLIGGAGDDTLGGDGGDNVLTGGGGGDTLQGGGGIDTASYAGASSGVIAALDSGLWMFHSGEALGDTFDQIENLLGSSYNDTLFGNSSDNHLDGGLGNDTLNAGAGDDTIYADQGNDTARGDIGNDVIHISADAADLPVQVDGGADVDTLVLGNLANVVGDYDFTALAGLDGRLENLEILDIREGVDTRIEITGQDILNMVDTGTELTVLADSGDVLDLSAFADEGESWSANIITPDHTEYIITDSGGELARIQWHMV